MFQKRSLLANIIIWSCMYVCHFFISSCCEGPPTPYEFLPGLSRANVPIAFRLYQCSSLETSGRPGRVDGSSVSVRWDTIFWWNFFARNLIELFRIRNDVEWKHNCLQQMQYESRVQHRPIDGFSVLLCWVIESYPN